MLRHEMLDIPAGVIRMRDDRIGEQWTCEIQPFRIASTPVTQAFYAEITGNQPAAILDQANPVECVSWFDAARFCNAISALEGLPEPYNISEDGSHLCEYRGGRGYRLPSEAEWEYACRATTSEPRYGNLDDIAWYKSNSEGHPHHVATKQPNSWGLYDMLGNVWEWCSDLYDPDTYGPYRIFRGGGWADHERGCLATNRRRSHPTFAIDDLGFRLAQSL